MTSRCPPGRAISRISITTITVLENSTPNAPAKPDSVFSFVSSSPSPRRRDSLLLALPPMWLRAFSGPRLAPPSSDTADTSTVPGTNRGSTCSSCRSAIRPGSSSGARAYSGSSSTAKPSAALTPVRCSASLRTLSADTPHASKGLLQLRHRPLQMTTRTAELACAR